MITTGKPARCPAIRGRRTFHQCLHAFASLCIDSPGLNIKTLQRVMGHSSISGTLDFYGHLMPQG